MAVVLLLSMAGPALAADQPNIVFIVADDLGRADCGFMGGKQIRTPNLDALAREGAILDAHYVQPVCSPTRAALMTGRYPMRHGLQVGVVRPWAQYGLPLQEDTLPGMLKRAGYVTGIFGKWHLGHFRPEYLPTRRGFDRQYGHYNGAIDYFEHTRDGGFDWHSDDKANRDEGYSTDLIGQEAAKFVTSNAGKKPFFCYVPFNAVHAPHQAPKKYTDLYPDLHGNRKIYAAMLTAMDDAVGRIVKAVDDAGIRDRTLFVLTSDNGGPNPGKITDNGPYRAGKGTLYEGGVRVAAFVTWKGQIEPGSTVAESLHAVDWYPTFKKLVGERSAPVKPLDGVDIWPTLTSGQRVSRSAILLNTTPNVGAIRMGDWKLIVRKGEDDPDNADSAPKKAGELVVELYDLKNDPFEKTNLADKELGRVAALQARLESFASQAVPPRSRPKPANFVSPKVWGESD
jgi:arylsulfatase A-like enzyme